MAIATIDAPQLSRKPGPVHPHFGRSALEELERDAPVPEPVSSGTTLVGISLNRQLAAFLRPPWGGQRPSRQGLPDAR